MYPPLFDVISDSSEVRLLIGPDVRCYPFGEAPQGVLLPYVVWQISGGSPENFLGNRPDVDSFSIQIDVYANNAADARSVTTALVDAIEPVAYVVSWNIEGRDPETKRYRKGFNVDWFVHR